MFENGRQLYEAFLSIFKKKKNYFTTSFWRSERWSTERVARNFEKSQLYEGKTSKIVPTAMRAKLQHETVHLGPLQNHRVSIPFIFSRGWYDSVHFHSGVKGKGRGKGRFSIKPDKKLMCLRKHWRNKRGSKHKSLARTAQWGPKADPK